VEDRQSGLIFSALKRCKTLIRIGMIGVGYWGPNLIRNFSDLDDAQVVSCSDLSQDRLNKIAKRYPGVKCTTSFEELLKDPAVDAVVIATPVSTHYPLPRPPSITASM